MLVFLAAMLLRALSQQSQWICVSSGRSGGSTVLADTECFNSSSLAWQSFPSLTLPSADYNKISFNLGGVACLAGGQIINNGMVVCTNASLLEDATSGFGWVPTNSLPLGSYPELSSLYGAGWVGIFGGFTSTDWITVNVSLGGSTNAAQALSVWTNRMSVSLNSLIGSAVALYNGTACVFGGLAGSITVASSYCLTGNQWVPGPNLVQPRQQHTPLSTPGRSCFVGGTKDSTTLSSVECSTNSSGFSLYAPYPQLVQAAVNFTLFGMPCVMGGGVDAPAVIYNTVICANFTGGTTIEWINGPDTISPRRDHVSFIIDTILPTIAPTSPTARSLALTQAPTSAPTSTALPSQQEWTCLTGTDYSTWATECLNTSTGQWNLVPVLAPPRCNDLVAFNLGQVSCIGGGFDPAASVYSRQVVCTNASLLTGSGPAGSAWVPMPPFVRDRYGSSVIYGAGWIGVAGGGADSTIEFIRAPNSTSVVGGLNLSWTKIPITLNVYTYVNVIVAINGTPCVVLENIRTTQCLTGNPLISNGPGVKWIPGPFLPTTNRTFGVALTFSDAGLWCMVGGVAGSVPTTNIDCINQTGGSNWTTMFSWTDAPMYPQNVSIQGLPCVTGLNSVWCGNMTRQVDGNLALEWIPMPNLVYSFGSYASFILADKSASPTLSLAPTLDPTPSPTAALPGIGPWSVDFPSSLSASSWSTFSIIEPVPSAYIIQWTFATLSPAMTIPILNTSQIQIPPFSFIFSPPSSPAPSTFTLTITNPSNGASVSSSWSFNVVWPVLSVQITGGDRDVAASTTIQLSYAGGNQIAVPNVSYNYSWEILPPCTLQIMPSTIAPAVRINTGSTAQSCAISLTVSDTLGRTSTAMSTLQVRVNLGFTVTVETTGGEVQFPFPTSSTLRLLGTVFPTQASTTSSYTYRWSIIPPLSVSCASNAISSSRALVVMPLCLDEGTNYTIVFTASDGVQSASSSLNFLTDTRPFGGTCLVTPTTGMALMTSFNVTCSSWSQLSQTSLIYTLKRMERDSSTSNTSAIAISLPQSRSQFPSVFFDLSAGNQQEVVTLVVEIASDSGEFTEVNVPDITLLPTNGACPSVNSSSPDDGRSNNNNNVQYFTSLVGAFSPPLVNPIMGDCTPLQRQTMWDALWQMAQQLVNLPYLDSNTIEVVSQVLVALLSVIPPSMVGIVTTPPNFGVTVGNIFLKLLDSPEGASTSSTNVVVSAVEAALPFLTSSTTPGSSCTILNQVIAALAAQIQFTTFGSLPGEKPIVLGSGGPISSSDISVTSATYFADSSGSLNSLSLTLPTSLLAQGGDLSRIVVTNYQSSLGRCRSDGQAALVVGPVVDITLSGNSGLEVLVTNVVGGFSFQLPFSTADPCGQSHCVWWDSAQATWRSDGCTAQESQDMKSVTCTCTHLTEFSLLLDPGCVTALYTDLYLVLMAAYALLVAVVAVKLVHRLSASCFKRGRGQVSLTSLVVQHCLILVLGIVRIAVCEMLSSTSGVRQLGLASRAAVLLLPYLIMFWIYTLMVFQWAALYHFGMQYNGSAFTRVRTLFAASNLLICGAIIAVLIAVGSVAVVAVNSDKVIVLIASLIIAVVTAITALAFLLYARVLFVAMGHATISHGSSTSGSQKCWSRWNVRHKIMGGGTIVSLMLCVESVLHIVSAISLATSSSKLMEGNASEVVTLVAELVCLYTLVVMYHRAMMTEGRKPKGKPEQSRKNEVAMVAPAPEHS